MILDLISLNKKYDMNITGIIHIGAHFGEEHKIYKKLGVNNIIYFEPVSKTFNELKKRIGNEAILFNFALGNENKKMKMYVEDNDAYGCSSLLKPSENYKNVKFTYGEEVEIKRLDEMQIDFFKYNFINIDVQGYELETLKGSINTLENIDYIMTETNKETKQKPLEYEGCSKFEELNEFLKTFNFELKEINWAGISWGDAFYIKKHENNSTNI